MDELQTALQRAVEIDSHVREISLHIHKNGSNEAIITLEGIVTSFYQKQIVQESVKRTCQRRDVQFVVVNNLCVMPNNPSLPKIRKGWLDIFEKIGKVKK